MATRPSPLRRRPSPPIRAWLTLILSLLSACSGPSEVLDPGAGDPDAPPRPQSIEITAPATSFASLGETIALSAVVRDQRGAVMEGQSVTWRSLAPAVVTVTSSGIAEAQSNGTATVEARAGDVSGSLELTVEQVMVLLEVNPPHMPLAHPGLEATFLASARDAQGNPAPPPPLTWRVVDEEIARINDAGRVTALRPGQTVIVAEGGGLRAAALLSVGSVSAHPASTTDVPVGGNAWVHHGSGAEVVSIGGVLNWRVAGSTVRTWVRVEQPGALFVSARVEDPDGPSGITVKVAGTDPQELAQGAGADEHRFGGSWWIEEAGYVPIDLVGTTRVGSTFGVPSQIRISGTATDAGTAFVRDNEGSMFHWGRRGPSTHLWWHLPEAVDVEWLYSEVEVPEGNDVPGSFFMANGFGEGYFGIQTLGGGGGLVLFSIWSPYQTDDPSSIPESHRVELLRRGPEVTVGTFGNEGSGGQSRLSFDWRAGERYGFLTRIHPNGDGTTDYTSWLHGPETGGWRLIASFRRPFTDTHARGVYSFLENFLPSTGNRTREARYDAQFVAGVDGRWHEVERLTFTTDDTGIRRYRTDYLGGTLDGVPFLRIGGFFSTEGEPGTVLTRRSLTSTPSVDLADLAELP
ncbi:MAG: DUF3472 domain-containing protein [Gemmatimonadales bacterium]|nr:MAG: DUF3472 domain-containing protein [Gemmatimonadales bacterium]